MIQKIMNGNKEWILRLVFGCLQVLLIILPLVWIGGAKLARVELQIEYLKESIDRREKHVIEKCNSYTDRRITDHILEIEKGK